MAYLTLAVAALCTLLACSAAYPHPKSPQLEGYPGPYVSSLPAETQVETCYADVNIPGVTSVKVCSDPASQCTTVDVQIPFVTRVYVKVCKTSSGACMASSSVPACSLGSFTLFTIPIPVPVPGYGTIDINIKVGIGTACVIVQVPKCTAAQAEVEEISFGQQQAYMQALPEASQSHSLWDTQNSREAAQTQNSRGH